MLVDSTDTIGAHDSSPWPAFADLLSATTLLFLILFAVVALPALLHDRATRAKQNTLHQLWSVLADSSALRSFSVDTVGDYLLVRIPEKATFPQDASDISTFQPEGFAILRDVANRIRRDSLLGSIDQIQVVGHTSSEGSDAYNWRLSSLRATTVAMILIDSLGLPPCQVTALGRARYYPVDPKRAHATAKPNPADRRIELEIRPAVTGDALQRARHDQCVANPGKP